MCYVNVRFLSSRLLMLNDFLSYSFGWPMKIHAISYINQHHGYIGTVTIAIASIRSLLYLVL